MTLALAPAVTNGGVQILKTAGSNLAGAYRLFQPDVARAIQAATDALKGGTTKQAAIKKGLESFNASGAGKAFQKEIALAKESAKPAIELFASNWGKLSAAASKQGNIQNMVVGSLEKLGLKGAAAKNLGAFLEKVTAKATTTDYKAAATFAQGEAKKLMAKTPGLVAWLKTGIASATSAAGGKTAATTATTATKVLATQGAKSGAKAASTLIPGLGLVVAAAFSIPTLLDSNAKPEAKFAATLTLLAGAAGCIPGPGTAVAGFLAPVAMGAEVGVALSGGTSGTEQVATAPQSNGWSANKTT